MFYFIYKTTNLIDGKFYIGQHRTNNIDDGYLGSGNILKQAVKKYGKENFRRSIITFALDGYELNRLEEQYVNKDLLNREDCYNLVTGGYHNVVVSEHTKQLLSIQRKGENNSWYGRKHTKESRAKMSLAIKTHRKFTDEYKKAKSIAIKNYYSIEENRIMLSRSHGITPFICVETGKEFNTISEASKVLGIYRSSISRVLSGKSHSTHGLHFQFK